MRDDAIAVMALDNLPCELPRDSSEDFGHMMIKGVFPHLFGDDNDEVIKRETQTNKNGQLTEQFAYLQAYVAGE
jgi:hypothetical protein